MDDVKTPAIREAYEAPVIEDIPLYAEEGMQVQNCKNTHPGGGFASTFIHSCVGAPKSCVNFHAS